MIFSRPVEEIIRMQHSVRNFTQEIISEEILEKILGFIKSLENPFLGDVSIYLINKENLPDNIRLGTYGMIKGGNYYLAGVSGNKDKDKLSLGFMLEKVVLYLTDLGLGSIWLGEDFNSSEFQKTVSILGQHKVRVVVPFGYKGGRKSIRGKLAEGSDSKRKEFSEIFFNGEDQRPLEIKDLGVFQLALEMLRLAPSVLNKQPWACAIREDEVDFYLTEETDFSLIDIGISIAHFTLTCKEENIEGSFVDTEYDQLPLGKYMGTFKINAKETNT